MKMIRRFSLMAVLSVLFCGASFAQTQPIPIWTWQGIEDTVYATPSGNYILMADITADENTVQNNGERSNDGTGYYYCQCTYPEGFKGVNFSGTFDGNGYTITVGNQRTSLFGNVTGTIKNLTLKDAYVDINNPSLESTSAYEAKWRRGILCFELGTSGRIENCAIVNSKIVAKGKVLAGGFVGMSYGTIENCYFQGDVSVEEKLWGSNDRDAGGIAGCVRDNAVLKGCCIDANSTVSTKASSTTQDLVSPGDPPTSRAAGIAVGRTNDASYNAIISGCYNAGAIIKAPLEASVFEPEPSEDSEQAYEVSNAPTTTTPNCFPGASEFETAQDLANYLNAGCTTPAYVVITIQNADGTTTEKVVHIMSPLAQGKAEGTYTAKPGTGSQTDPTDWEFTPGNSGDGTNMVIPDGSEITFEKPTNADVTVEDGGQVVVGDNASNGKDENGNPIFTVTVKEGVDANMWNFIGFPIKENNGVSYLLPDQVEHNGEMVSTGTGINGGVWALEYNYAGNTWANQYLHWSEQFGGWNDFVDQANGIFVFPEQSNTITITGTAFKHSESITVTKDITAVGGNRFMALANPYTANLPVSTFASQNLQGNCIYKYDGRNGQYQAVECTDENAEILVGEGFFVNLADGVSSATISQSVSAEVAQTEYIELSVITDGVVAPVRFAVDESANVSFDRFDANKLFGDGTVAEPFFVKDGYKLCKEVVNQLPYTAALNVRSSEARTVEIVANYIPEAYDVVLVDGQEEIALENGTRYSAELVDGDNADRFSLKISRNAASIQEMATAEDIKVRNNNRMVSIDGGNNISVEVYNALGQKVYETRDHNFELNGVAAGAYVVNVKSGSASHSTKIVVR